MSTKFLLMRRLRIVKELKQNLTLFLGTSFVTLITILSMTTHESAEHRSKCKVTDELMAVIYEDEYFSRPENRKSRDELVKRMLKASICANS